MKNALIWTKRALAALVVMFLIYQVWLFGWVVYWNYFNPKSTSFMSIRLAELRETQPDAQLQQQWLPYDKISDNLKSALIASEDAKFVDHEGFDWDGIQHAIEKNQKKGKVVAGGSTITQQLAKNLFLSPSRSALRKGEEAIITLMLEAVMEKERIFEIYLNVIEWGNGIFGAEAAARHYYGISASQLSAAQAAKLAAMVPNPRYYDTHQGAPGLAKKTGIILRRMSASDVP